MDRQWRGAWFRATDRAYSIERVLPRERGFNRDLLPGERALGGFILPPFQRPPVWTPRQKIRLIESILDELPVPPYVANRDVGEGHRYDHWLLDGQQRITAILDFLGDQFPVRGARFSEVSKGDQFWFLDRPLHCLETELRDEALLKEVHDRLAYGGTPAAAREAA